MRHILFRPLFSNCAQHHPDIRLNLEGWRVEEQLSAHFFVSYIHWFVMAAKSEVQGKKWLREASMRRLSLFVKNKTELIGNAAQLGMGVLHPDTLEKSGLSTVEIYHLEQWVAGS